MLKLRLLLVTMALVFSVGCLEGPMGPEGEKGDKGDTGIQGDPAKFYTKDGVLYTADLVNGLYWDIPCYWIEDSVMVQVWVRQGAGKMWQTPTWYLSIQNWYVRIVKDDITSEQDEYLVIGMTPSGRSEKIFAGWKGVE